jgi:hypothetical protein
MLTACILLLIKLGDPGDEKRKRRARVIYRHIAGCGTSHGQVTSRRAVTGSGGAGGCVTWPGRKGGHYSDTEGGW